MNAGVQAKTKAITLSIRVLELRRKAVSSVTVVAQTAMLADALATAAFVLGPESGIQLLERMGVDGLIVSSTLRSI